MPPKARDEDVEDGVPEPKGIKYASLESEHARQIIEERIAQLEREHYNHTLNLTIAKDNPSFSKDDPEDSEKAKQFKDAVKSTKRALNDIEAAHATLSAELKKLS